MRVCIVAFVVPQHAIGGMQDHTRDLARGLVLAGHEVEVITSRHPEGMREERKDGVHYVFVDAPRHQNHPTWLRQSYAEFVRRHAQRPFDVIHSESSSAVEHVRRGVHREVPLVAMFHGGLLGVAKADLSRGLRARRLMPLLRAIRSVQWTATHEHFRHGSWYRFRACEAIVPSRQQVKPTARACFLKASRVHVVPNGIDAERFRPRSAAAARAQLGLGDGPLFVCAGRLSPDKGVHHAIRALSLLDGEWSSARLVIVGDGEERERLERLTEQLGMGRRVIFTGAKSPDVVPSYLAASNVFLFPTERDEAAPLILPQAMACARPVVASSIGGIPEVIAKSGEYGLLIPPGNVEAIADAMRVLMRDESLRARLGEAARQRVLAEYTVERMVERTLDVYRIAIRRLSKQAEQTSSR